MAAASSIGAGLAQGFAGDRSGGWRQSDDSGVRRGAGILTALCLGAQFVFFGRPTLYGAVAGGLPGVKKAFDIFRGEIDLVMGQIGCPSLDQLGPDFLWREDWTQNR
jgi:(S)-mandelate dehydrogenase